MRRDLSFVLMLLFLIGVAAFARHLTRAGERENIPSRISLSEFPLQFDVWRQVDAQTLTAGEFKELKPDDYISRTYLNEEGFPVFLFIAWYASQRHRQTIHSPQNCQLFPPRHSVGLLPLKTQLSKEQVRLHLLLAALKCRRGVVADGQAAR